MIKLGGSTDSMFSTRDDDACKCFFPSNIARNSKNRFIKSEHVGEVDKTVDIATLCFLHPDRCRVTVTVTATIEEGG